MNDATVADIAGRMREIASERTEAPLILAIDVATRSGFARGRIGEAPVSGSIRFGRESTDCNVIFGAALAWLSDFLDPRPRPDVMVVEAMLSPAAMAQLRNTKEVRDRLAGLHGVIRGVAHLRGITDVRECNVGDIRSHFIGDRKLKRKAAKRAVMEQCRRLGWACKDDNAADALAIWSYAAALIDPATAIRTVPLFNRALIL